MATQLERGYNYSRELEVDKVGEGKNFPKTFHLNGLMTITLGFAFCC